MIRCVSIHIYTYIYANVYDMTRYTVYGRDVYDVYIVERYVFIYLHAYA